MVFIQTDKPIYTPRQSGKNSAPNQGRLCYFLAQDIYSHSTSFDTLPGVQLGSSNLLGQADKLLRIFIDGKLNYPNVIKTVNEDCFKPFLWFVKSEISSNLGRASKVGKQEKQSAKENIKGANHNPLICTDVNTYCVKRSTVCLYHSDH